jgi:hypothetical protein
MKVRSVPFYRSAFLLLILAAGSTFCGCKHRLDGNSSSSGKEYSVFMPSVRHFLEGQVERLKAVTVPLSVSNMHNGKEDVVPFQTDSLTSMLAPFVLPGADDASTSDLYTRSTFPDSSHHRMVVSYQAQNDSTSLNRVDIYLDPDSKDIRQLYLQCSRTEGDSLVRQQLIWKADRSFTLIRTIEKHDFTSDIRQQKVIWDQRP